MIERQLYEQKTEIPLTKGISTLLQDVVELGPLAPELILRHADEFASRMLPWEVVRKDRGPKLLGKPGNATGFEGLMYRQTVTAGEMLYTIANTVEQELSYDVRLHPGDNMIRNRREKVLYQRNFTDLRALKELEILFIAVKNRIRKEQIQNPAHEKAYDQFRTETYIGVKQSQASVVFSFDQKTGLFEQKVSIPSIRTEQLAPGDHIPYSQTGYEYALQLGIVGHPILRVFLSVPELIAYHELRHPNGRVNLASRNSQIYQDLRDRLERRFINRYLTAS